MSNINNYLPKCLRDIIEFQYINGTLDTYLTRADGYADKVQSEVIIDTASLLGVEKWEDTLGIYPSATDTLDERKFRIKSILVNKLPYTEWWLNNKLSILLEDEASFVVEVDYDGYAVNINLDLFKIELLIIIEQELRDAIPSNMILRLGGDPTADQESYIGTGFHIATKYEFES